MIDQFRYVSHAQEVIFAPGALARLGETVERFGWHRLMLYTNRSMQAAGHVDSIKSVLEEGLVVVFDQVQPHVQDLQVNGPLTPACERKADAVIGMGAGSPIGMAKAMAS